MMAAISEPWSQVRTPARSFWQRAEGRDEGVMQLAGRVSLWQRDQTQIPGASVEERGNGGLAAKGHDEAALPVAESLTQLDDRWPPVDEDGGRNESGYALIKSAAFLPQKAPVLGLELHPALTYPPRHQHSSMIKECCDKR